MGLSIHYSGSLRDFSLVDELVKEVQRISELFQWKYDLIDSADNQVKGILASPEGSEPLVLTFMPDGRLYSFLAFILADKYADEKIEPNYTISTKTQFAGINAHIEIIKLLKYLKTKYFKEFKLTDEGNYWETGDIEELKTNFENYSRAMDIVTSALINISKIPAESAKDLAARIEKALKKRLGGNGFDIQKFD